MSRKQKLKQDLCAILIMAFFIVSFVTQVLSYFEIWERPLWSSYIFGFIIIAGFLLLRSLAVNTAGEIFATGEAFLEFYYTVVVPYLRGLAAADAVDNASIYLVCIGFCIVGLYLWSILLANNKFAVADMRWIVFLPMNHLINICVYWDSIDGIGWTRALFDGYADGNPFFMPIRWILLPAMLIGYWRMAHSRFFSGETHDLKFAALSPFNRYFGSYMLVVAIMLLIY